MKLFLIATTLISSLICVRAQQIGNPNNLTAFIKTDKPAIDTPRYSYFLKASIDINQWERAKDTIVGVMGGYGRRYYPEEAETYRNMLYRQIAKLNFTLDSIRIDKPKK